MKMSLRATYAALMCASLVCLCIAFVHTLSVEESYAPTRELEPIEEYTGMRIQNHMVNAPVMTERERQAMFAQYESLHQNIMNPQNRTVARRFLVVDFHPSVGAGNRMMSLASAYAVALVTSRALLVQWESSVTKQDNEMTYQVDISALFQDPGFKWRYGSYTEKTRKAIGLGVPKFSTTLRFPDDTWSNKFYDTFLCGDYLRTYDRFDTVTWSNTQDYYLPMFQLNGEYGGIAARLWNVFGDQAFAIIARQIFRPVPAIVEKINTELEFIERPFTALQLRTKHFTALNLSMAIQCASTNSYILVITDDRRILPSVRRQGVIHVPWGTMTGRQSIEAQQDAIVEMWLMSRADSIVATEISTFGAVTYGMSRTIPRIIRFDGSCWERNTSQPFQWSFFALNKKRTCIGKTLYAPAALSQEIANAMETSGDVKLYR